MYATQPTLFILGKDFVQPISVRYSDIVGSKLYQGMAFIATLICKSMALRDGIASALIDFNISKQEYIFEQK
jgi:hypothetical protein